MSKNDSSPSLPLSNCQHAACYISCLSCPSASILHYQYPALLYCSSVGLLHDLQYLLLCQFYLSVGLMHATSPAFPVHLPAGNRDSNTVQNAKILKRQERIERNVEKDRVDRTE